jgi:hypothetical protein
MYFNVRQGTLNVEVMTPIDPIIVLELTRLQAKTRELHRYALVKLRRKNDTKLDEHYKEQARIGQRAYMTKVQQDDEKYKQHKAYQYEYRLKNKQKTLYNSTHSR